MTDSNWTARDRGIVHLRMPPDRRHVVTSAREMPPVRIIGVRPGRTTIRIAGVHGALDSMYRAAHRPVPSVLTRDVIVTLPVASVRVSPRPFSVQVGDSVTFSARVRDVKGKVLAHAPVWLTRIGGTGVRFYELHVPRVVHFEMSGRYTFLATAGGRADTLVVFADSTRSEGRCRGMRRVAFPLATTRVFEGVCQDIVD